MSARRIGWAAAISGSLGLAFVALAQGLSPSLPLRLLELGALFVAGGLLLGAPLLWLGLRMADWREPEPQFERRVQRSECLARGGLATEPGEEEFLSLDPLDDAEFEELVGEALDELPDWARRALERNVAVVISDRGRADGLYGLYEGDGAAGDAEPDRIVIYRDSLRRDFGDDPEELAAEVVRTVRHELAHHLGFDELGVQELGL